MVTKFLLFVYWEAKKTNLGSTICGILLQRCFRPFEAEYLGLRLELLFQKTFLLF